MKQRTQLILKVMNVLSWIVFIGLMVKAGAILTSYCISIANPAIAKKLYMEVNLYKLSQYDFGNYTAVALMMAAIEILRAYTAYLVIKVLSKVKLANPFTTEVSNILERISYFILLTWIAVVLYNGHTKWLSEKIAGLQANLISEEFIFLAGVVFVISQIFKRGVEIQSENELTV